EAPDGEVPVRQADLVEVYAGGEPLVALAKLVTRRTTHRLWDEDSEPMAEVDDDRVEWSVPSGPRGRFREVEVELGSAGDQAVLEAVEDLLLNAGARPSSGKPKIGVALERAAAAVARVPPAPAAGDAVEDAQPSSAPEVEAPPTEAPATAPAGGAEAAAVVEVEADAGLVGDAEVASDASTRGIAHGAKGPSPTELLQASLRSSLERLVSHDPFVRLGGDEEDVHQARVATRRMRADLSTFAPIVDPGWLAAVSADLKELAGLFGAVRDADVLLMRLEEAVARLPEEEDRAAAAGLCDMLTGQRDEDRTKLLAYMRGPAYVRLVALLRTAAEALPVNPAGVADFHPLELLELRWAKLAKRVRKLGRPPADDDLHQVRIDAKKARYVAESVAPVVGGRATKLARELAGLQGVLGDLHDAVVTREWLRQAALKSDPEQAYAAGQLAAMETAARGDSYKEWPREWKAVRKRAAKLWPR
ncbi:MAG TPA: CHAD domain-containing protein, partial [Acidimicrobiales bacterium]|nr:CHAD domain-containing protein [Acidimicrobiales bacterium]